MLDTSLSYIEQIKDPFLVEHNVELFIKRDDLIHPDISGNKWRKLKYNVIKCVEEKRDGIVTFGGAYSNHLLATAAACKEVGLKSVGIVRGDELNVNSNQTLIDCTKLGMNLKFISRNDYNRKVDKDFLQDLALENPNHMIIPEGGANYLGIIGCQEILTDDITEEFTDIIVSQGTSATSCGILLALRDDQKLHVFPALKGYDSIGEMQSILASTMFEKEMIGEMLENVIPQNEYHFGGYGKFDESLIQFIQEFHQKTSLKLDPIYTGKTMFGLYDLIRKGAFGNRKILFIHTGGLQGVRGVESKMGCAMFS